MTSFSRYRVVRPVVYLLGRWWGLLIVVATVSAVTLLVWSRLGDPTLVGSVYVIGGMLQLTTLVYGAAQLLQRAALVDSRLRQLERDAQRARTAAALARATRKPGSDTAMITAITMVLMETVFQALLVRRSDRVVLALGLLGFVAQQMTGFPSSD